MTLMGPGRARDESALLEGFRKLRMGALLQLLALLVLLLAIAFMAPFMAEGMGHRPQDLPGPGALTAAMASAAAALLLAGLLSLAGFAIMLSAGGEFGRYDPDRLGRGPSSTRLVVGGLAAFVVGLALAVAGLGLLGFLLVFLGLLAVFGGLILFSIFLMDLAKLRDDGLPVPEGFRTAGLLMLVGTLLYIPMVTAPLGALLQIAGIILLYTNASDAVKALESRARSGPWRPPPAPARP